MSGPCWLLQLARLGVFLAGANGVVAQLRQAGVDTHHAQPFVGRVAEASLALDAAARAVEGDVMQ
eukprot:6213744-Pleurochrysis_carterae.AAC.3